MLATRADDKHTGVTICLFEGRKVATSRDAMGLLHLLNSSHSGIGVKLSRGLASGRVHGKDEEETETNVSSSLGCGDTGIKLLGVGILV